MLDFMMLFSVDMVLQVLVNSTIFSTCTCRLWLEIKQNFLWGDSFKLVLGLVFVLLWVFFIYCSPHLCDSTRSTFSMFYLNCFLSLILVMVMVSYRDIQYMYVHVLKDLGTFLKRPLVYYKLTGFEDNDGGKLPSNITN